MYQFFLIQFSLSGSHTWRHAEIRGSLLLFLHSVAGRRRSVAGNWLFGFLRSGKLPLPLLRQHAFFRGGCLRIYFLTDNNFKQFSKWFHTGHEKNFMGQTWKLCFAIFVYWFFYLLVVSISFGKKSKKFKQKIDKLWQSFVCRCLKTTPICLTNVFLFLNKCLLNCLNFFADI